MALPGTEFNDNCFKQMEKIEAIVVIRERTAILIWIVFCFRRAVDEIQSAVLPISKSLVGMHHR